MAIRSGTRGSDSIVGTGRDDALFGGAGDDAIQGQGGHDALLGEAGDDRLWGNDGNDRVDGGSGDDVMEGDAGRDTLLGGSGNDVLYGHDRAHALRSFVFDEAFLAYFDPSLTGEGVDNRLDGGRGNDTLLGANGNDRLEGGSGDDVASAGLGSDRWLGGSGNDALFLELDGRDRIDGGGGTDKVMAWLGADQDMAHRFVVQGSDGVLSAGGKTVVTIRNVEIFGIDGSSANDRYDGRGAAQVKFGGQDGDDALIGSRGNDWLEGGAGSDTMIGGAGDDQIFDSLDGLDIRTGSGADSVRVGYPYVFGPRELSGSVDLGSGSDSVEFLLTGDAASGRVVVHGGTGSDLLRFAQSDLAGDATADLAGVRTGSVTIDASGIDRLELHTGRGKDTLTGGSGNDTLDAGTGRDIVTGGYGDDVLAIAHGGRADGGAGSDHLKLDLHDQADGLELKLDSGRFAVDASTSFVGIESLDLSAGTGGDAITGGAGDDRLADGSGSDRLDGGGGNDVFLRGVYDTEARGVDYLGLDPGTDFIDGGAGFDTLRFAPHQVQIDLVQWIPVVEGEIVIDLEQQSLNAGLARGLTVANLEHVEAGVSEDVLKGSAGADSFDGRSRNDVLAGRGGDDVLEGGSGADDLAGGTGRDQFVYRAGFAAAYQSYGYALPEDASGDRIRDFTRGEDKLVFTGIEAAAVRSAGTPRPSGYGPQFFFDTDTHELFYDSNGRDAGGIEVRVAVLDGVAKLDASDFVFA